MTSGSIFPITVDRLCRVRSGTHGDELPFALDEDGFLDPSAPHIEGAEILLPGALVPPNVAAEAGALVLLGEPGIGKTRVFEQLVGGMPERRENLRKPGVEWVDAADLVDETFEEMLGMHFKTLPSQQDTVTKTDARGASSARRSMVPSLTIVIDQIDESPTVRRLAGRVRRALEGRDTSGLRLLLACRTADYPSNLTAVVESACGQCVLADLAPLTRQEATQLASSVTNVDGKAVIRAAIDAGAVALANVPLTLGLLIRAYRQTGSLNARPTELFCARS
jgi:hypothetical protein